MKRKFILVMDADSMNEKSVVAIVWVGSSRKESLLLKRVRDLCDSRGYWFEPWAEHVDQRLWYENARVFHRDGYFMNHFRTACFSLVETLKMIEGGNLQSTIENTVVTKSRMFLVSLFHPACVSISQKLHAISPLLTPRRKYLSPSERSERFNAGIAFGLISVLYVLSMILESVERWLLG